MDRTFIDDMTKMIIRPHTIEKLGDVNGTQGLHKW